MKITHFDFHVSGTSQYAPPGISKVSLRSDIASLLIADPTRRLRRVGSAFNNHTHGDITEAGMCHM